MKIRTCLILGFFALSLSSCLTGGDNDNDGYAQSSVVIAVNQLTSLQFNYAPADLNGLPNGSGTYTWDATNNQLTTTSVVNDATVTKTCTVPQALVNEITQFWQEAQICQSTFIYTDPNSHLICDALAIAPAAIFFGPNSAEFAVSPAFTTASDCTGDVYYICATADNSLLATILDDIFSSSSGISCQ